MILAEFIDKVFNRYKCTAPDLEDKKDEYTSALFSKTGKVDFQKLLDVIAKEHEGDFIPNASKILEWSARCYKTEYKREYKPYIQVKVYNPLYKTITNTSCFPVGTTQEEMIKTYEKIFPDTIGWRIIEVY